MDMQLYYSLFEINENVFSEGNEETFSIGKQSERSKVEDAKYYITQNIIFKRKLDGSEPDEIVLLGNKGEKVYAHFKRFLLSMESEGGIWTKV